MGCFTSNIEPNVAPRNRLLGAWFYPVDYKLIKTKTVIDKKITELKKILSQMFPNIWSYLDWERTMVLDIVDGAMPKVGQTTKDRIDIRTQIPNLFLAGDTTAGDGWGGDIAFDSAVKCASAITGYLKTSS
jgi:phytoene dehydrogenase-like protein